MTEADSIYHEHQSLELCALHALNNLFQGIAFSKQSLDEICKALAPDTSVWNPHRSFIGLGNYDVNVIMQALQSKDCAAMWFDKRKDPRCLNLDNVVGFIMNIPSQPKFGPIKIPFIRRRHWIAVREIAGAYHNLDSKLDSPELIGSADDLRDFLRKAIDSKDKEVFVVVNRAVEQDRTWLQPSFR